MLFLLGDYSSVHAAAMARSGARLLAGVCGNHCSQDYMAGHGIIDLVGDRAPPARTSSLPVPEYRPVPVLAVQGCVRHMSDGEDVLFDAAVTPVKLLTPTTSVVHHMQTVSQRLIVETHTVMLRRSATALTRVRASG